MTSSSWYRGSYWQVKGKREFTRSGYEAAAVRFEPKDLDVDLTGRHIMITGGNKGLGLQTGHELAKRGAVLHLVCRNMDDARDARSSIVSETGNDKIHLYHLDLSKPREVIKFCEDFQQTHDRLHVLINNAGAMLHERTLDPDGLEYNFAVNTLAVHLLVTGLVPLLERNEDSRVITVSSGGMLLVKLDPDDLTFEKMVPFEGRLAYSQTKRQQVLLTLNYAQMYDKVHFSAMHPGWADTLSVRTAIPDFYEANKERLRTVAQGADTIVWLAASSKAAAHPSGLFFQDRVPVPTHLPLAWTRSTVAEERRFLEQLLEIATGLQPRAPEVDPRVPEVEPRAPEVEPRAPEVEPRAPEVEPRAPEVEPRAPEVEPRAPEVEPRAPEVELRAPEVEPRAPEVKPLTRASQDEQKPKLKSPSPQGADREIQAGEASALSANDSKKEDNSIEVGARELPASDASPPNSLTPPTDFQKAADVPKDSLQHPANESVSTEGRIETEVRNEAAESDVAAHSPPLEAAVMGEASVQATLS